MRIAIVNDLMMAVEALRRAIEGVEGYEVVWIARDGSQAVQKCSEDTPDLVLMDLIMPVMDGVEATRRIMEVCPCIILVVTATVEGNAAKVFEAMGYGALDAVNTPVLGTDGGLDGAAELIGKIGRLGKLLKLPDGDQKADVACRSSTVSEGGGLPPLVAVGCSTGGPKALSAVLSRLPASFDASVIIVQHVDRQFAPGLASWLQEQTAMRVVLAGDGDRPRSGTVFLAATDDHLVMLPRRVLGYSREPLECPYRPSVDVFFSSLAAYWPCPSVAMLLTGMGRDGARGLLSLKQAGWHTIAQDESSSVVYGMPKAAKSLGAVEETLPPERMGPALVSALRGLAGRQPGPC